MYWKLIVATWAAQPNEWEDWIFESHSRLGAGVALALAQTQQVTQRFVSLFLPENTQESPEYSRQTVQCHIPR